MMSKRVHLLDSSATSYHQDLVLGERERVEVQKRHWEQNRQGFKNCIVVDHTWSCPDTLQARCEIQSSGNSMERPS